MTEGFDTTGYYECRWCGYRISAVEFMKARNNYPCIRCYRESISGFKRIPGDKEDETIGEMQDW